MEMEQLNKSQLVLLTLLVSFVTSIATGIVTVSLMQQAPPAITQTVNKVVEHTVEKIVPGQSAAAAAPAPVTKTVVVTQTDTVAQAVENVADSVVRLTSTDTTSPAFISLGIILDKKGTIVTDEAALGDSADAVVTLPGGASVRMFVIERTESGLAYLAPATTTDPTITWAPAMLASGHATVGSMAIVIGGKMSTRVAAGIITGFSPLIAKGAAAPQVLETDIVEGSILPGAPLVDSSGALLGLSSGSARLIAKQGFISSTIIAVPKH